MYGPLFRRELRAAALRRDAYTLRCVTAALLGLAVVVPVVFLLGWGALDRGVYRAADLKNFGLAALVGVPAVQVLVLAFLVPSMAGAAVAEERERGTLTSLLLSRLTRWEIILVKLCGRLVPALALSLVGLPLVWFAADFSAQPAELGAVAVLSVLGSTAVMGALSVLASARYEVVGTARAAAMLYVWFWLLVVPVLAVLPVPSTPLVDDAVRAFRAAAALASPSSPFSYLTSNAWARTSDISVLRRQFLVSSATQAAVVLLAYAAAAASLRRLDPRPTSTDPFHGFRPACGDDPVYWREFDLPNRTGSAFKPLVWVAQLAALLKLLFQVLVRIVSLLLVLGVPVALVVFSVRLGRPAFLETWYGTGDRARGEFNAMIRGTTAFFTFLGLSGATSVASAKVTVERDKSTWLPLLATPLGGREILGGKMRATARGLAGVAYLLVPLWLAGVACGAAHPAGAALVAVDLALAAWLGVAAGTWFGARPGATSTASSFAALVSLALVALHVPYALAALFTRQDIQTVRGAGPRAVWAAALALAGVPAVTGLLALAVTRRTFAKFDAWVGRPARRPPGRR